MLKCRAVEQEGVFVEWYDFNGFSNRDRKEEVVENQWPGYSEQLTMSECRQLRSYFREKI